LVEKRKGIGKGWILSLFLILLLLGIAVGALWYFHPWDDSPEESGVKDLPDWIDVQLIRVDGASRRAEALAEVKDVAVHYVGNPGTSAQANRNWFDNPSSEVSSHFIVGLEGEVILCVPLDEKSSATNHRNLDTISVEVCHPDESGEFSPITYASLIRLLSWLCEEYGLNEDNLIRHYDVTGKNCPRYYVENESAWLKLKDDVKNSITGAKE